MPYRLQGRGSDYYRIYGEKDGTTKEYHHDIAFDELGDVLDSMIEIGGMTKEECQAKVKNFVCSLRHQFFRRKVSVKHKKTIFIQVHPKNEWAWYHPVFFQGARCDKTDA